MSSWAQEHERMGLEKGLEKGLELGLKTGEQKGQARTLVRMLERRFGALSSKLRSRVLSADTTTLDIWADRFVEGGDLDSILASGPPNAKVVALKANAPVRRSRRIPTAG